MAELRLSIAELARRADVDQGTVGDFLNGKRWPRSDTRGAIETALEWQAGAIGSLAEGQLPYVGPEVQDPDGGVLLDLPDEALAGLSDLEREEVLAAAKETALRKAREIRGR